MLSYMLVGRGRQKKHNKLLKNQKNTLFIKIDGIWTWDLSRKLRHAKQYTKTGLKTKNG